MRETPNDEQTGSRAALDRKAELAKVFGTFDMDGSGTVEAKELMVLGTARQTLGHKKRVWTEERNARMIANMDKGSKDGKIGAHHGWAECSLVMAENVLASKFGVPPPAWMNATVYDEYVRFHDEPAERARRSGWHQG